MDELRAIITNSHLAIVGISETWLKPYIINNRVDIEGYIKYSETIDVKEQEVVF